MMIINKTSSSFVSFFTSFLVECKKQKHKKHFLFLLFFISIQFLWGFYAQRPTNDNDLKQGYLSCFYFFTILNTIIYPIFIAVMASRLCDMEIKGDTLKLLYTLQEKEHFYDCKYFISLILASLTILAEAFCILILGKYYHFEDIVSLKTMPIFLFSTLLVVSALLSIQQALSLLSQNQILPLLVGLIGSFLGLFSLFFPTRFARLILFGYFSAFLKIKTDWNRQTRFVRYYDNGVDIPLLLCFFLFSVGLYFFCRWITVKREQ